MSDKQPNIVLIMSDDLGYEVIGANGGTSYATPRLDRMAQEGMRFEEAHVMPLCTPTRLSLMTGKYNFRNYIGFGLIQPDEVTFGHLFSDAGYNTCISGKWQLYSYNPPDEAPEMRSKGQRIEDAGFDEFCVWHAHHTEDKGSRYKDPIIYQNGEYRNDTEGKYGEDVFCDYIIDYIGRKKDDDSPFFVYWPMAGDAQASRTHTGQSRMGVVRPSLQQDSRREDVGGVGRRLLGRRPALLQGHGRVPRQGHSAGSRTTWTSRASAKTRWYCTWATTAAPTTSARWCTSTTRYAAARVRRTTAARTSRSSAVCPERVPAGVVNSDMVESTDFLPTIMEAAGLEFPDGYMVDGRSFYPQLTGEDGNPRDWMFFHFEPMSARNAARRIRFVRDNHWKLYETGELYDLRIDLDEELPIHEALETDEQSGARARLRPIFEELK